MHGPTCIFWANLTPFSLQYCRYMLPGLPAILVFNNLNVFLVTQRIPRPSMAASLFANLCVSIPPRDSDPQERFLWGQRYMFYCKSLRKFSWAQVTFLGRNPGPRSAYRRPTSSRAPSASASSARPLGLGRIIVSAIKVSNMLAIMS